jgi:hypothetical protein
MMDFPMVKTSPLEDGWAGTRSRAVRFGGLGKDGFYGGVESSVVNIKCGLNMI